MSDNSNGSGQAPTRFEGLGGTAAFVGRGIQRWSIGLAAAAAVMGCAPFALGVSDNAGEFLRIFIALLVLLAAAAVLGAGLGLLFGMPREAGRARHRSARFVPGKQQPDQGV